MARKKSTPKSIEALTHAEAKRKNIPSAALQPVVGGGIATARCAGSRNHQ